MVLKVPESASFYRWIIAIMFGVIMGLSGYNIGTESPLGRMIQLRERVITVEQENIAIDKNITEIKVRLDEVSKTNSEIKAGIANILGRMDRGDIKK